MRKKRVRRFLAMGQNSIHVLYEIVFIVLAITAVWGAVKAI